ncbi:hypothetical protein IJ579_00220 [bacterium]|nr:hypothetical protein [bacterium]
MIGSILSSQTLYALTQNTAAQVSIETGLKTIGRPGFILLDKNIDPKTKKYSAMKEFLYQISCLGISLGIVIPQFKKGSFKIARKIFKDEPVFNVFKKTKDFLKYYKLDETQKLLKLEEINKIHNTNYKKEDINEDLAKGTIEALSIIGSMLGLSIFAPLVSRPFIRPILKLVGLNEKKQDSLNISA